MRDSINSGDSHVKEPQRWNRTWTTIRDASEDGEICIQLYEGSAIGSENCLYLNIYVPFISEERRKPEKLSVLVFVHGGKFMIGSSDSKMYAPDYLLNQDVILVTMNYRLSSLGFFSTSNQASPGNYGIKDVKMALEWVQENIHSFEGNPKSVTLMGHSAGSALTHILALSQKTEGLFHRYILHSGSAINAWSVHAPRRYRQLCLQLAKLAGCQMQTDDDIIAPNKTTTENPKGKDVKTSTQNRTSTLIVRDDEELMRCMRSVDAERLETMTQYFSIWRDHPWCTFGPTLEVDSKDAILTMHPWKIVKEGLFRDIPAIFQVVEDEGLAKTIELITNPEVEDELIENFEEYLCPFLEYNEVISNTSLFASAIEDYYFNGNVSLGIAHNLTKTASDGLIIWPMFRAAQYHSERGNSSIYFSYFTYHGTFTFTFSSGISVHYGITHGDDLNYFFPILNYLFRDMLLHNTENDITIINVVTEMWTSFAINGTPNAWNTPAWPKYRDHHEFMRFGIDRLSDVVVQTDFLSDRMEFWGKLMHNVLAESVNDNVFVSEPPKDVDSNNAIDYRSAVQLALFAIICFITSQLFIRMN
ncbi:PREDICTED: esterase FE4-like isoform X2 [Vollenhovia emeryi]|uniref:esterase FE4-like isoform X2 n=1 Tax=Vollenhovia emeryi TaxID=411798 RepID=UPI0005F38D6E|nr:PREDICTED: esterase FE4-like isoform X2 [Vollenhovia emeryi]